MSNIYISFENPIRQIDQKIEELKAISSKGEVDFELEISQLLERRQEKLKELYSNLKPIERVHVARHPERPIFPDYLDNLFTDFIELHGDRHFRDDRALIGGMANFNDIPVMVIGQQRGKNTKENVERNFGMPHPEGYRKALRLMKLADRYKRPIINFVDTKGAYPGLGAEERGQSEAIATNLIEMAKLEVPVIVIITGEGGSGGALAIALGDYIMMLENAVYSVISPEGCASILWREAQYAPQAANALKITSNDLLELKIVDEVVSEPLGGAHRDYNTTMTNLKKALENALKTFNKTSWEKLPDKRYEKYKIMGKFIDGNA